MTSEIADRMTFPETPEEMYAMLRLEDVVKRERQFTHIGMNAYMIFEYLKGGGELRGIVARGVLQSHWDAEGNRSTDDAGVPVL